MIDLPYRPRDPKAYHPAIGLIGCGGITETHLRAYKSAGYNVVALCDLDRDRAEGRRAKFYPDAAVTTDYQEILGRDDIEVVDVALHPAARIPVVEAALRAKKHVLSQKPFALDLDTGARLADLADAQGVKLAVNQNGRWAPHFSWIREAVHAGLLGDVTSIHVSLHWDHSWTVGTPFEEIHDLILYDFAIHWFDFAASLMPDSRPFTRVQAFRTRSADQLGRPPMLAEAIAQFEGGQASFIFDSHVRYGPRDTTFVGGSKGAIFSAGPHLGEQTLTLTTAEGDVTPTLEGSWFPDGFHGTMAELLCAIEEDREPRNSARNNLKSLALCFAAIESATDGVPKVLGEVRRLPEGSAPGA